MYTSKLAQQVSILELKPILMRFFEEVEDYQRVIKELQSHSEYQEIELKKLRGEGDIYRKVLKMYEDGDHAVETMSHESLNTVVNDPVIKEVVIEAHEVRRGRKRKYNTEEERREKKKEANRKYRDKQKEGE
jgi:predicted double-glycine peptidase